jgi:excisionase family DNA binding protein
MNLKTAAAQLSVHYQTAYKLVRSGSLAAVKIGGTYEISEAALERYRAEREALRAGAEAVRDVAPPPLRSREAAIAEVWEVARSSTTTTRGVLETVARVVAEVVGDYGVVRVCDEDGDGFAFHDADPTRRAALAAIVHGFGFGAGGPTGAYAHVRASQRTLLLPHVAQDRLRTSLDSQHRQFLDVLGVHSLVIAPVVIDDVVRAVVTLGRATPGAPYGNDEVAFAEEMASALALTMRRTGAYRQGWARRGELVAAVRAKLRDGAAPTALDGVLDDDGLAEIVYDLDDRVLANAATSRLTGGDASLLVDGFTTLAGADGTDRLRTGDLEYHDGEHDVRLANGTTQRFIVHRGLVRDDRARARALVVVAQPVPAA